MPFPKKLTCEDASKIVAAFFSGIFVQELSQTYRVSRATITRLIERKTYKKCAKLNIMVNALGTLDYFDKIEAQMSANKRNGPKKYSKGA